MLAMRHNSAMGICCIRGIHRATYIFIYKDTQAAASHMLEIFKLRSKSEARCALGLLAQPFRIMTGSRVTQTHTACSVQNTQNFTACRARDFFTAQIMLPDTRLQRTQTCLCLKV